MTRALRRGRRSSTARPAGRARVTAARLGDRGPGRSVERRRESAGLRECSHGSGQRHAPLAVAVAGGRARPGQSRGQREHRRGASGPDPRGQAAQHKHEQALWVAIWHSPASMRARGCWAGLADRACARVRPAAVASGAAAGAGARLAARGMEGAAAGAAARAAASCAAGAVATSAAVTAVAAMAGTAAGAAAGTAVPRRGSSRLDGMTATGTARASHRPAATRRTRGRPGCAPPKAAAPRN